MLVLRFSSFELGVLPVRLVEAESPPGPLPEEELPDENGSFEDETLEDPLEGGVADALEEPMPPDGGGPLDDEADGELEEPMPPGEGGPLDDGALEDPMPPDADEPIDG